MPVVPYGLASLSDALRLALPVADRDAVTVAVSLENIRVTPHPDGDRDKKHLTAVQYYQQY